MSRALPASARPLRMPRWLSWRVVAIVIGLVLAFDLLAYFAVEWLWFDNLGYARVFERRWLTQMVIGSVTFGFSYLWLLSHLVIARRWQHHQVTPLSVAEAVSPERRRGLSLRVLLPLTLALALLLTIMLVYHGQVVQDYWRPQLTLYNTMNGLPLQFRPAAIVQIGQMLSQQGWGLGLAIAGAVALLIYPEPLLFAIAVLMSASFGLVLSEQWLRILPGLQPTAFGRTDPLFHQDIGFYVFQLPILQLIEYWLAGLFSCSLTAITLMYFLSGQSLSQGRFPGFSIRQKRHLCFLSSALMLTIALGHWLARYELLFSKRGVAYGANYADIHVQLPIDTLLTLIALVIGLALLNRAIFWGIRFSDLWAWAVEIGHRRLEYRTPIQRRSSSTRPILYVLAIYIALTTLIGVLVPAIVQSLVVQPNELVRELPYIKHTIDFTRTAFALDTVEVETFLPQGNLTYDTLQTNDSTIRNIRLWDTRPLLESNRQLQQIRLYYEFPDADIDRYDIKQPDGTLNRRQVLISARELNYDRVPEEAKTWVNEHLIYTHGYGFTMSPVNTASTSGLPEYFIQDIAHTPSNDRVEASIPVGAPRIYFGELTNTYIMTQTRVQELDYPSGSDNVYTQYQGRGGVNIGTLWRKLLFARHLWDWQMLFTQDFTPDTRLLFRRNIVERVRTIAPFFRYDSDPYLVVADADFNADPNSAAAPLSITNGDEENYLYWVIDGYTTSDRYPYSDPAENDFNYIRNSVKVVIDAYHGSVYFYVADLTDPMIQTWSKIFPGMLRPLAAMPSTLQSHIRYPQDFYQVQSNELMTYHMTDPQVFYNREDQWRAPNEIYGREAQRVEPYYLIMKLPDAEQAEFILLRPYTPSQRNNMIAWLAARSDGDRYGSMLLYRFPKQELVFGPEQIEARINQDPVISQQISLWDRQGSQAIQGNLLVIPIDQSLLYVEPLYLEAEQNRLPILARVIVVYQNRIAMAETLEAAIDAIFRPDAQLTTSPNSAIIRELDATTPEEQLLDVDADLAPTLAPSDATP